MDLTEPRARTTRSLRPNRRGINGWFLLPAGGALGATATPLSGLTILAVLAIVGGALLTISVMGKQRSGVSAR